MSQPKSLEDLPPPTRTDTHAETIAIHKNLRTGEPASGADIATIAPPRLTETITATGPRDSLPLQQLLATVTQLEPGAQALDAPVPSGRLGQYG